MPSTIDKLLVQNRNVLKKLPVLRTVAGAYLSGRFPLSLADLAFTPKYSNSYALISEKNSDPFIRVMKHVDTYLGVGFYGPNKYWEYPWTLANLKLERGMKVLDAGCGTSPIQYVLSRLGCEVHGIDPNEGVEWHGIDRGLAARLGCAIQYRVESIDALSYPSETFDRVCCVSVIEHCRAQRVDDELTTPLTDDDRALHRRMMNQMVRVLKPGGLLVLTTDYYVPRSNSLLEANVDIANLLATPETETVGVRCPEWFPCEPGFDPDAVVRNGDIDVVSHVDRLQTSIGITLRKIG